LSGAFPEWVSEPLDRIIDYAEESRRLLHMSMQGIYMLRAIPKAVEAIEIRNQGPDKYEGPHTSMEEAQEIARLALAEKERGYPILHAHALVGLWAAFEAAVEDLLVGFLINDLTILKKDEFAKIRISLREFELLEKEERMRFLLGEFEKNQGVGRKHGADRFEVLLEPFGLSGVLAPEIKKDIREMYHIRNVLVHRGGKADRRIVEGCSWLEYSLGQEITVTPGAMARYEQSLMKYVIEIICRCRRKFGFSFRPGEKDGETPEGNGWTPAREMGGDQESGSCTRNVQRLRES
jgi:hypothetical protein